MRLHRFYTKEATGGKEITIHDEALLHQWFRVFRYEAGSQVVLFSGDGQDYVYEIGTHDKTSASLILLDVRKSLPDPAVKLHVAFSLIKKDNVELILQKCTELGVASFTPIVSERSEKKGFNPERARKIVIEACEQSGRGILPSLDEPLSLRRFLDTVSGRVIAFHSDGAPLLSTSVSSDGETTILIGPEGGWSVDELDLFRKRKIALHSLGTLTLRAETAAIAASALVLTK